MFDFGFNELLLLSILIIVFFGPKELPVVLRAIHNFFSKLLNKLQVQLRAPKFWDIIKKNL